MRLGSLPITFLLILGIYAFAVDAAKNKTIKTRIKKETSKKSSASGKDFGNSTFADLSFNSTANSTSLWETLCDPENSFRCKNTGHCLPQSWFCDGEEDCIDNSDETAEECVKHKEDLEKLCTEKGQFRCISHDCIDQKLVCDGKEDCLDGWSDEADCPVHQACYRDKGEFLCKSGECIHHSKVCDKTNDCKDKSDEFLGCENSCKNTSCHQGCLPDPKFNGTDTGTCFCHPGYTPTHHSKGSCEDVDECQVFGTCSQKCTNLVGSYGCSCISGFHLTGNSSCELIENNATLIFAKRLSIQIHKITNEDFRAEVAHNYTKIEGQGLTISVTYDARNGWVYWSDVREQEEAIYRSKLDGTQKEKVVTTGLILPEGIAFDWIANNIYFTDSNMSHIIVCTANGGNCSVIIKELSKPRDIALHPNLGLLYWTNWGIGPSIMKAGMDGSIPIAIITENMKWPNGIAIDQGNDRIYWTDARLDRIETATLDGEDRIIVHSTRIVHPFGIDVLGDHVYWSDWNLHEIQKSNKFDGSNHQTLVKEGYEQLNGLAVYHKANQPIIRTNHCQNAGCSHICTLTPTNSFKCKCPIGMNLDRRNKRKCAVSRGWPQFIVGYNNTLKLSPIDAIGGNTFQEFALPRLKNIVAIATIPFNTTVFLSDLETRKIYAFDTKTRSLTTIVDSVDYAKGLDYDEVGNNLYWVDSTRKTVEVMSLKTRTRVVLFKEIDRPEDIALAPSLRLLFLAQMSDKGAKIVRMNMNGFNRRVLFRRSRAQPVSLTYSVDLNQVFWADSASETIESVGIDGGGGYHAISRAGSPFGITSYRSTLYWADRHLQVMKGKDLLTFKDSRPLFLGDYEPMKRGISHSYTGNNMPAKLGIMNNDPRVSDQVLVGHDCSGQNNKCSHVCLLAKDDMEGTCVCPDHLKLDTDGHSCQALTEKDTPTPVVCSGGRCRVSPTTKKPSKSSKSSKSSNKQEEGEIGGGKSGSKDKSDKTGSKTSSISTTTQPPSLDDFDGFNAWISSDYDDFNGPPSVKKPSKDKSGKKSSSTSSSNSGFDRESRNLDYDNYVDSLSPDAIIMSDGSIRHKGESVLQQESHVEKDVIEEGTAHPFAIALGVIFLLILVAVIIGIVLYRRKVHPKVLVRPYVQQWVKYVNQPVQRFFVGDRGEQLDGGKRHIYDEVYHSPTTGSEHSYSRAYENIDEDSSVHVYEDPGDSHRISYSQTDKLL